MANKYFSKLNVIDSSGISQEAYVKDAEARAEIEKLKNIKGINYIGQSTGVAYRDESEESSDPIEDGMVVNETPGSGRHIKVDNVKYYFVPGGSIKYVKSGDLITVKKTIGGKEQEMEYIITVVESSGTYTATFHEFGSTGSLKALAFKDSATVTGNAASHSHTYSKAKLTDSSLVLKNGTVTSSGTYTPAGTNSSSAVSASGSYTPAGTNADSSVSASGSFKPAGTNAASSVSASGSFKPAGTNAASSVTLTGGSTGKLVTSTVKQVTSTDASTLCKVSYDESTETIDFTPVTFENVTVATGSVAANGSGSTVATALPTGGTAAAQTFTGTSGTVNVTGTAAAQTFTGTAKDVSVSGTAAAQVFTGTAKSVSVSGTGNTTVDHFNVSIGYDTVNSGTAAPSISGTAS